MTKVRILSIDGGGTKGVIPAYFLKKLEYITEKPISELFDYIIGTSIGGIMAIGYAIPDKDANPAYNSQDMYNLIEDKIDDVMPKDWWSLFKNTGGFFYSKYDRDGLDKLLEELSLNKTLLETTIPISVLTYSIKTFEPKAWSTFKACQTPTEENAYLSDIAGATSAAPTYFDPKEIRGTNGDLHIDGGVYAKNPSLVGITEFLLYNPQITKEDLIIVSIGTGNLEHEVSSHNHYGLYEWLLGDHDLISLFLYSSTVSTTKECKKVFKNFYRIQPDIPEELYVEVDGTSDEFFKNMKKISKNYYFDNKDLFYELKQILDIDPSEKFHFNCSNYQGTDLFDI